MDRARFEFAEGGTHPILRSRPSEGLSEGLQPFRLQIRRSTSLNYRPTLGFHLHVSSFLIFLLGFICLPYWVNVSMIRTFNKICPTVTPSIFSVS